MKYQLIQAFNMKQALIKIHEEFGGDALICRTRNSVGGMEILIAIPDKNEVNQINIINNFSPSHDYMHQRVQLALKPTTEIKKQKSQTSRLKKISKGLKNFILHRKKLKSLERLIVKPINELNNVVTRFRMKLHNHLHSRTINAFVGPSGAGKTTTIIKIAVQYLANHTSDEIGIISNNIDDLYLSNKLNHFCRISQIDFQHVNRIDEFNQALDNMSGKKIILIDTHGISHRDIPAMNNQRGILEKCVEPISVYLVIPASNQPAVIDDMIQFYTFKHLEGCILTKADESLSLTPAIEILDKCDMPLIYICNGEDLENDIYSVKLDPSIISVSLDKHHDLNIPVYSTQSANW